MATNPDVIDAPVIDPPAGDPPPVAADTPDAEPFKLPEDFDWRSHWAGENEKHQKLAARYASPQALLDAHTKLQAKLSSGKVIEPVGEDATDEEKAAYRKALNVPESPDGYYEKLPAALTVGPDDREMIDRYVNVMHEAGAPKSVADALIKTFLDEKDEIASAHLDEVAVAKKACEDALREEWATPGEYRRNDNILQNYLSTLPEAIRDAFDKGLDADGIPLGYNPEIRRWLVDRALEENPGVTVVPGAGANQASAIADEIAGIKAKMGTPAYAKDEKMQERYRELLDAQSRMNARGG